MCPCSCVFNFCVYLLLISSSDLFLSFQFAIFFDFVAILFDLFSWVWSEDGFFYGRVLDYAGGGAVHMVGGIAAFSGAWILGPRIGRFEHDEATDAWSSHPIRGHDSVLAATGTFILWFGFFPFNAASGMNIVGEGLLQTGRVVTVTALGGASGCLTLLFYGIYFTKEKNIDLGLSMNGLLGGMVATCSGVGYYDPWVGLVVGSTGSLVYYALAWFMEFKLRIDDPLGAAPLHLGCGAWGMIMAGFFANSAYVVDPKHAGIFYGGDGTQLGWQILGVVTDFSWTMATCSLMFWTMNYFGIFRVSKEAELMGMDVHHHGGTAYPRGSVSVEFASKSSLRHFSQDNIQHDINTINENGEQKEGNGADRDNKKGQDETATVENNEQGMRRRHRSSFGTTTDRGSI
jgi:ammonia channel protein AmtB